MLLSAAFERCETYVRRKLRASGDFTGGEILDALFREITILGFIGLWLETNTGGRKYNVLRA